MKAPNKLPHTDRLPTYPSMSSCAGATGIPMGVIKSAKRAGCEAFTDASRVKLEPLLRWIFSDEKTGEDTNWSSKLDEYRAKREAIKLKKDEASALDADEVRDAVASGVSMMFAEQERLFVNELPPALKGIDEIAIRARCETAIAQIKRSVREKIGKLIE